MNQNREAFLHMLSVSEGTSTSAATKDRGYDVIVTGFDKEPEIFFSYAAHPFAPEYPGNGGKPRPSKIVRAGLTSNAAGRYQHMLVHWSHYRDKLGLKDFGPESQDLWALQLIRERSALPLIDGGQFDLAVARVRNLWASLPGAGYGQPEHRIEKLRAAYAAAGGTFA